MAPRKQTNINLYTRGIIGFPNYNMKSMNFSQANPDFTTALPASLEHEEEEEEEEDGVVWTPPVSAAGFLWHKKKFLDPSEISSASLSKPGSATNRETKHSPSEFTIHAPTPTKIKIHVK